jgi:hypothetical protein
MRRAVVRLMTRAVRRGKSTGRARILTRTGQCTTATGQTGNRTATGHTQTKALSTREAGRTVLSMVCTSHAHHSSPSAAMPTYCIMSAHTGWANSICYIRLLPGQGMGRSPRVPSHGVRSPRACGRTGSTTQTRRTSCRSFNILTDTHSERKECSTHAFNSNEQHWRLIRIKPGVVARMYSTALEVRAQSRLL